MPDHFEPSDHGRLPRTELEQWAVLKTVVEAGSFAKAAERLHRSQSSISYAIARLQERIGIALLRIEGRRALLTDAGRLLLSEATPLIDDLERIERRGRLMASGQEPRIRLLVDSLFPKPRLFAALASFQAEHPYAEIVLREIVRRLPSESQGLGHDLAISMWDDQRRPAYPVVDIELIAVARPDHPLHARKSRLTPAVLARYTGLMIDSPGSQPSDIGDGLIWHVNTLETAVEAVRHGLCHGWLPRHLIEADLARGALKPLPLASASTRIIPLRLSYADEDMAGPLTRSLAALLLKTPAA